MGQTLSVLLVEDSADDAELIERELVRGGFQPVIRRVETEADMRRWLAEGDWQVVLSDFNLPCFSAAKSLDTLHASGKDLPFIILSGAVQAEDAVTLLKRGAHDFLNKDSLARLVPAIERELREAAERAKRRLAEERVRMLSLAVEQSPVSVVVTDGQGAIQYVNPKFEEVTGWPLADAVGKDFGFTAKDETGPEVFRALWETVRSGAAWRGELCNRRRDGSLFWEHVTVSPLKNADGAVGNFIAVKEDITARLSLEERLLRQANFDELTGLPNRVLMLDRLDQAIAQANRSAMLAAVLYIDLDRFKNINDGLGHAAGDRLLAQIGGRLGECMREGDTLARMGADEFVVILSAIEDGGAAQRVAERVTAMMEVPFVLEGQEHFITASIGAALYPADGTEPQVLLRNSELAMYRAKENGRNCCQFFTFEINRRLQQRLALERRLRGAAGRGEMLLHYQPILDLRTGRLVAAEALVRWRQDDGSLTMPGSFISVAEETGMIRELGDWVAATACAEMKPLLQGPGPLTRVALNVSPCQLQVDGFGLTIARLLETTNLSPDSLELEITESVLMDDKPATAANLGMLCELGIRLSIDDFGTGYSSLGYLHRYPFRTLKIDRSFIEAAPNNRNVARLVESIIGMAHGLGLDVIAEGVETEQQADFLRARNCDHVQGFLFSRPLPLVDFVGQVA